MPEENYSRGRVYANERAIDRYQFIFINVKKNTYIERNKQIIRKKSVTLVIFIFFIFLYV